MTEPLDLEAIEARANGAWPTSHDVTDLLAEVRRLRAVAARRAGETNKMAMRYEAARQELAEAWAVGWQDRDDNCPGGFTQSPAEAGTPNPYEQRGSS